MHGILELYLTTLSTVVNVHLIYKGSPLALKEEGLKGKWHFPNLSGINFSSFVIMDAWSAASSIHRKSLMPAVLWSVLVLTTPSVILSSYLLTQGITQTATCWRPSAAIYRYGPVVGNDVSIPGQELLGW